MAKGFVREKLLRQAMEDYEEKKCSYIPTKALLNYNQ